MTDKSLLIEIRWPDGRFHGVRDGGRPGRSEAVAPEWPPSPFRLFQALVAGAYGGRWASEEPAAKDEAFRWLEGLEPPTIAGPGAEPLRPVTYYVPNNDLDSVGGDPDRVNEIRSAKTLRTSLFDPERPVAYLWTFEGDDGPARRMAELADRLHTLGRGIDAAWARAEVLDPDEGEAKLLALGGSPRRPGGRAIAGDGAPVPATGSLDSLKTRHAETRARFQRVGAGRKAQRYFRQPAKAHFRTVAYARSPERLLYELSPPPGDGGRFAPWPLHAASALATTLRDHLAASLGKKYPREVARLVVGESAGERDKPLRLRILPIPSIGGRHTDQDLRRLLVEVPPDFPVPIADLASVLEGRTLERPDGVVVTLTPTSDRSMLRHYGVSQSGREAPSRVWRTVTPAALPQEAGRRRIDPDRLAAEAELKPADRAEAKGGAQRAEEEGRAAAAIRDALRHAGIAAPVVSVRVQREPLDAKGLRAEAFAAGTRFAKERLWHAEIAFAQPVSGPLAIGDGRYVGLGLLRTVDAPAKRRSRDGVHVLAITEGPGLDQADASAFCRALRRAVLKRASDALGLRSLDRDLPAFFHGHSPDGGPRLGQHAHLFFALDPGGADRPARALVIAPHLADQSHGGLDETRKHLKALSDALDGLHDLRAGSLGRFGLAPAELLAGDPVFGQGRAWASLTPYRPTRHPKRGTDLDAHLRADIAAELRRRNLPTAEIDIAEATTGARGGVQASMHLTFRRQVTGPLLLGRNSHFGEGLFTRSG